MSHRLEIVGIDHPDVGVKHVTARCLNLFSADILATTLYFNWPEVEAETAPLDSA